MKAFLDNKKDAAREIAKKYNVKMSAESINLLADLLQQVHFRHRTFILEAGDVSRDMLYIVRGLVRQYYNKEGDETDHVVDVVREGYMLVCSESLFSGKPSGLNVHTLEPTYAYGMNYKDFKKLASENKEICTLLSAIMEAVVLQKDEMCNMLDGTPIEKYLALMAKDAEIIRRTSLRYIASYLRMAPETLSRVRFKVHNREGNEDAIV